jgi:hypothetical protein
MAAGGVIVGGSYEFQHLGRTRVAGLLLPHHRPRPRHQPRPRHVRRPRRPLRPAGRLAYHLGIPDRLVESPPASPSKTAAPTSPTPPTPPLLPHRIIDGRGGIIDLDRFTVGLVHDWTGAYARALHDFQGGRPEQALPPSPRSTPKAPAPPPSTTSSAAPTGPAATSTPPSPPARGVRNACASQGDKLLPAAAGILTDLGIVFKRLGMNGKAAHCLLHALRLRPNHPDALLTFVDPVPPDRRPRHIYALGRALAIGHHHGPRRSRCADRPRAARAAPRTPPILRGKADDAAARVDLADLAARPARPRPAPHLPRRPRPPRPARLTAQRPEDTLLGPRPAAGAPRRPWWKFW